MKFSEYFKLWAHENYYKNAVKIGKSGDFYTAVSVGNLFGTLLAKHFLSLIDSKKLTLPCEVVEIGANEGFLSRDFLAALLFLRPSIFENISFFIIEPHEKLQILQRKNLNEVDFTHKKSLEECKFQNAFFFSNELFDSFDCELIDNEKMAFVNDDKIEFQTMPSEIKKQILALSLQKGEFCVELESFFKLLNESCDKLIFSSFDYGVFTPERFSIRIYKEHQIHSVFESDLKQFFGKSDITYNVNFSHIKMLIQKHNFTLLNLKKQKEALLEFGFDELILETQNEALKQSFLKQAKNLLFNFDEKFHFFEFAKL